MKTHTLKTISPYFELLWSGAKTFECRLNDRGYQVGDELRLREYDASNSTYRGSEIHAVVTHILYDDHVGVAEGYCVMSIKLLGKHNGLQK
jgi:ASC-1-like (ASCH) protein